MKKLILGLMATSALAIAAPALAHEYPGQGSDWDQEGATYDQFDQQFDHIREGIQHGLSDGTFNRYQASRFYGELRTLERQVSYYQNNDGYLAPNEVRWIQARLTRLHNIMHDVHDRGHETQENYGYGYNGYGYADRHSPYSYNRYQYRSYDGVRR
jgi:hypothetical protein